MSEDEEWMRAVDALRLVGNSPAAVYAIFARADAGLIKARAKRYTDGTGRISYNVQLPRDFWWAKSDMPVQNWPIGDFEALARDARVGRSQAFGVTFRRSDIEQMISPEPQGASGASLSSTQTRAAPPDGDEWISAAEAIAFLPHGQRAICRNAREGLVRARARRLTWAGEQHDNADVPPEFWWQNGGEALTQDWRSGDFETYERGRHFSIVKAFGVTFRRADIERLKPATAANPTALPSLAPEPVPSRKVFIVHGRNENAKNEVALFLQKIGLEDIVLHQRPNRGRNLLTKFQEEAEGASFAVILMTPDDDGGLAGGPQQKRARQNVVFELGFFIGKFEPSRVAALIVPGVEKPSDFEGICWIEFGRGTNWKNELARELKEAGVPFDPNKLLHG